MNATIRLVDLATNKPLNATSFTYSLTRTDPSPTTIISNRLVTTDANGNITISIGTIAFGNYTLQINYAGSGVNLPYSVTQAFTAYKALPALVISPGWIQNAFVGRTYTFKTSIVNNATQSLIAQPGLVESVTVNDGLLGTYSTDSGGNVTFTWGTNVSGQYKIKVSLASQNYYAASSMSITISVSRKSVTLIVTSSRSDPNIGEPVVWNITAYDQMNNRTVSTPVTITQYIDHSIANSSTTNSNGYVLFGPRFGVSAAHNVTFVSSTTQDYNSALAYKPIKAYTSSVLTLQTTTVAIGQQTTISFTLKDSSGLTISSRTIRVEIDNTFSQNVTTDGYGTGRFTWTSTKLGDHSVTLRLTRCTDSTCLAMNPVSGATLGLWDWVSPNQMQLCGYASDVTDPNGVVALASTNPTCTCAICGTCIPGAGEERLAS